MAGVSPPRTGQQGKTEVEVPLMVAVGVHLEKKWSLVAELAKSFGELRWMVEALAAFATDGGLFSPNCLKSILPNLE